VDGSLILLLRGFDRSRASFVAGISTGFFIFVPHHRWAAAELRLE